MNPSPSTIDKIAAQIAEFRDTLATARQTCHALEQRAAEIQAAPPTREMVRDRVFAALEVRTPAVEESLDRMIRWSAAVRPEDFNEGFHTNMTIPLLNLEPNMIMAVLWPQLLTGIDAKIASIEWSPLALSNEEKAAQLAALEPQRQAARAAVEQLEAQGVKLGIS